MGLGSMNGVHTRHQKLHLIACSKVSINYDDFGSKNNNEVETSFVDLLNDIPKLGTLSDKTNKNMTKHVVWIESLNYKKNAKLESLVGIDDAIKPSLHEKNIFDFPSLLVLLRCINNLSSHNIW